MSTEDLTDDDLDRQWWGGLTDAEQTREVALLAAVGFGATLIGLPLIGLLCWAVLTYIPA